MSRPEASVPSQVLGARRRERVAEVDRVRIVGRDQRREDRDEHEYADHDPAGDRGRRGVDAGIQRRR